MNKRQEMAINFFIETGDSLNSLIKAGYSEKYAQSKENTYFNNPDIINYLDKKLNNNTQDTTPKKDIPTEIASYLTMVMRGEDDGANLTQRMKAAELLCKHYNSDNNNKNDNIPIIIKDNI